MLSDQGVEWIVNKSKLKRSSDAIQQEPKSKLIAGLRYLRFAFPLTSTNPIKT